VVRVAVVVLEALDPGARPEEEDVGGLLEVAPPLVAQVLEVVVVREVLVGPVPGAGEHELVEHAALVRRLGQGEADRAEPLALGVLVRARELRVADHPAAVAARRDAIDRV
jgi:hypothetical protein